MRLFMVIGDIFLFNIVILHYLIYLLIINLIFLVILFSNFLNFKNFNLLFIFQKIFSLTKLEIYMFIIHHKFFNLILKYKVTKNYLKEKFFTNFERP